MNTITVSQNFTRKPITRNGMLALNVLNEQRRIKAISYLGEKYVCHRAQYVRHLRKPCQFIVFDPTRSPSFFSQAYGRVRRSNLVAENPTPFG